ncbi:MAG: hypothetical protein ACI4DS_01245 [Eubacterium sp.]
MLKSIDKKIYLWILAVIVNIKSIFTDFGTDQAYAVTMSFRHLQGDRLFQEMGEPHQTSAFITDLLMAIYKRFVPDLEYVALYLQVSGVILYAVVTILLFKELKHFVNCDLAHYMCLFFFIFRPKQSVFPEFSNMQICFSVMLFIFLLKFFRNQVKTYPLILAAIFLCLEILSYPTCLIVYFAIIILMYTFCKNKWKSIAIFTGVCILCGGIYIAFIISCVGIDNLWESIQFILQADASHGENTFDVVYYFKDFIYGIIWIGGVIVASYGAFIFAKKCKKTISFLSCMGINLLLTEILMIFVSRKTDIDWSCMYFIILLLLIGIGAMNHKCLEGEGKILYYLGSTISVCSVIAVFFLTNLSFISLLGYLILGAMVSLIPINQFAVSKKIESENTKKVSNIVVIILILFLFHRGMVVCGYANEEGIKLAIDVENIIRVGPTKGIVASLQKCNQVKGTLEDWQMYVNDDEVLVVVPWMLDSIVYLYPNTGISAFSTINTPTYDENLLKYWEIYPQKMPTVIAVECWNGEIPIDKNSWIMKWIDDNYTSHIDGSFWRFYRCE